MSKFKPMLAAECSDTVDTLRFPLMGSPKLGGFRCVIRDGKALTRSLKEIPNRYIFNLLSRPEYEGLDGELIIGKPNDPDVYRNTNSGVMSREGEPQFMFWVFDDFTDPSVGFYNRLVSVGERTAGMSGFPTNMLAHYEVESLEELLELESRVLLDGGEGIMLRDPEGVYKLGRSTLKQQGLLKLKRFSHDEAVVLEMLEEMENQNEAKTNALGHTERSSHKENMVGKQRLGSILVRDLETGVEFNIGSGFTAEERERFWRDSLVGKVVRYKHFKVGVKDLPRFPTYDGLRNVEDM